MTPGAGRPYLFAGVVAVAVALGVGEVLVGRGTAPGTDEAVQGASVLGLFYVLAQGVERVVELLIGLVHRLPGAFAETVKRQALAAMASGAADARDVVEQARQDLGVLGHGLSFAVAYLVVCWFGTGLFEVSGLVTTGTRLDLLLTAVAVTGGSKSLHDVIARVEKGKERTETRVATG